MQKKITTKEIAKLANVSVGTVDRVLHNRGQVSTKTREKVLAIIKSGNYKPNLFARNLALNKTFSIVSIMPSFHKNEYWEAPSTGVINAIAELKQFGLNLTSLTYKTTQPSSFTAQVLEVVESKPDAVILAPVFKRETFKLAKKLADAAIPYIFIDSNLPDLPALAFVGQDSYQSGYLAAKLLDYGSRDSSQHLILSILDDQEDNIINSQRISGYEAYFSEKGESKNVLKAEVSLRNLTDRIQHIIAQSPKELNIFVPNSKVYRIASILSSKRKKRRIKIIGYDLIKANRDQLELGNIDFIIDQKAQLQGYKAVQIIYQHLVLKQAVDRSYYMPIDVITRENLMYSDA